jgi:hypothetical protein
MFSSGFQEDTFATDSLRHILTLLSSLDTHAFTLLASISLTNRSRVKDLWIFTGLVPIDHDASLSESAASSNANIVVTTTGRNAGPEFSGHVGPVPQHKRRPSAPAGPTTYPQNQPHPYPHPPRAALHVRAATERIAPSIPYPAGVLRKPAPRAQVPVSVNVDALMDTEPSPDEEQFRAVLPSVISSDAENMTGVGAVARGGGVSAYTPDIIYTTPGQDYVSMGQPSSPGSPMAAAKRPRSSSPQSGRSPPRPVSTRAKTPPLLTNLSQPSSPVANRGSSAPQSLSPLPQAGQPISGKTPTPPLLSAGVFTGDMRDSTFSSSTDTSREIPIKWTGGFDPDAANKTDRPEGSKLKRVSVEPQLPGGWSISPDEEKTEAATTVGMAVDIVTEKDTNVKDEPRQIFPLAQEKTPERPLHDVDARVASPELVSNTDGMRKSEAGLTGMVPSAPHAQEKEAEMRSPAKREANGAGWVLVNVEGKSRPEGVTPVQSQDTLRAPKVTDVATPKSQATATLSPSAKSVVILDAKDAKLAKDNGKTKDTVSHTRPSGLRRLLSFSKRVGTPEESASESPVSPTSAAGGQKGQQNPSRTKIRDRLKRKGVSDASDNRRLSLN